MHVAFFASYHSNSIELIQKQKTTKICLLKCKNVIIAIHTLHDKYHAVLEGMFTN